MAHRQASAGRAARHVPRRDLGGMPCLCLLRCIFSWEDLAPRKHPTQPSGVPSAILHQRTPSAAVLSCSVYLEPRLSPFPGVSVERSREHRSSPFILFLLDQSTIPHRFVSTSRPTRGSVSAIPLHLTRAFHGSSHTACACQGTVIRRLAVAVGGSVYNPVLRSTPLVRPSLATTT